VKDLQRLLATVFGVGLVVGLAGNASLAIATRSNQPSPFRRIEQPLSVKIAVTLGGLALAGAEIWWFQFSRTRSRRATTQQGIQSISITVDGGYTPDRIVVRAGQPVRLNFFRKDPSSCLEAVVLPDFHRAADLPLDRITIVEFLPDRAGIFEFHCGMNMFRGTIEVLEPEANFSTS
jgi:plastocyanin domain-containing protein